MTFPEKLQSVFDKYGTTELKVHMLLNLYDDVLAVYAEDQKERKKKLQTFYDNLRGNIIVDNKLGYHVAMETKELLKIVEELLKE